LPASCWGLSPSRPVGRLDYYQGKSFLRNPCGGVGLGDGVIDAVGVGDGNGVADGLGLGVGVRDGVGEGTGVVGIT